MAAIRREIKELEAQLDVKDREFEEVNDQLRVAVQDRSNVEEDLHQLNFRLKAMLEELAQRRADAKGEPAIRLTKRTMAELDRTVDRIITEMLEEKLSNETFTASLIEQTAASSGDTVRVEFEGDEVFWSLQAPRCLRAAHAPLTPVAPRPVGP